MPTLPLTPRPGTPIPTAPPTRLRPRTPLDGTLRTPVPPSPSVGLKVGIRRRARLGPQEREGRPALLLASWDPGGGRGRRSGEEVDDGGRGSPGAAAFEATDRERRHWPVDGSGVSVPKPEKLRGKREGRERAPQNVKAKRTQRTIWRTVILPSPLLKSHSRRAQPVRSAGRVLPTTVSCAPALCW